MQKDKKSFLEKIFPLGIPLAWLQLISEKKRFTVAILGITLASTMMLFQIAMQSALFKQTVDPLLLLDGEVFIVSSNYEYFGVGRGFGTVRLYQARALDQVEDVNAIKLGTMPFKNVNDGGEKDIFAIAFDPTKNVFISKDIQQQQHLLKKDYSVLFDSLSRSQYGTVVDKIKEQNPLRTELNCIKTNIEGLIKIGPTFAADGNVLMSLNTFDKIWPTNLKNVVNVGVIKIKNPENANEVVAQLKKIYPNDVKVMTKNKFISSEKEYWATRTPIGFVIGASMLVSIFVGAIVVYQILYTDVTDHIPEYATLKAIGFSDRFFVSIILQESLILSILGFVPGFFLALGLYKLTRDISGMATYMSFTNASIVFCLTLFMCIIAGLLATRKLRNANPADIF